MGMAGAAEVAQKWARNLGQATESIKNGVNRVTVAPQQQAAAAQDKYVAGVQAAVQSGKWQRGLQRSTLSDWKNGMLNKGMSRIASGATAAVPKMQSFMTQFLPFLDGVTQQVKAMPSTTLQDRINRAVAQMQGTAQFQRQ